MSRKQGSITLFLAIVLPCILLGTLALADLFRFRQNLSKVYKVTYAVSEAELSCRNQYFHEHYSMMACHDRERTAEVLEEYYRKNRIASEPEISVEYDRLSVPLHFRSTAMDASLGLLVHATVDAVKEGLDLAEGDAELLRAKETIDGLQVSLSECFVIPEGWLKWDVDQSMDMVRTRVNEYRVAMQRNLRDFGIHQSGIRFEADKLDETLRNGTLQDLEVLREEYEHHHRLVDSLLERLISQKADYDSKEEELARLLEEFQIPGKAREEVERLRLEIEDCRKRVSEGRREFERAFREGLGKQGGGLFAEFLKQLNTLKENLTRNLSFTSSEGKSLSLDEMYDHTGAKSASSLPNGSLLDKLRINEWAVGVFRSYDIQCPRKVPRKEITREIRGEVEYLISGEKEESRSFLEVKVKLTGLRLLPNMALGITDAGLMREISVATAAIPPPFQLIARGACFSAICIAESYVDVEKLLKGYGIPVLKSRDDWVIRWSTLVSQTLAGALESPPKPDGILDSKLYYLDYLRILLAMQSEKQTLLRAMNLIESDLRRRTEKQRGLEDFSIGHRIDVRWNNDGLFRSEEAELHFVNSYRREAE